MKGTIEHLTKFFKSIQEVDLKVVEERRGPYLPLPRKGLLLWISLIDSITAC